MTNGTVEALKEVHAECIELGMRKNHDYSGVADNIALTGIDGIAVRIFDKASRLLTLSRNMTTPRKVVDETIEDTLKDLANYASYGVVLLRGKWQG